MARDKTTGQYYVDVDWSEFYKLSEDEVRNEIRDAQLLSDEEARDTGLLGSKYFEFACST